jgi:two-component system response regulator (stage 0 sporulation protein F)
MSGGYSHDARFIGQVADSGRRRHTVFLPSAAGDKALQKVLTHKFDLIIVDLRLPGMDGLALIRAVRQFEPFMRIIVMTAYGSPELEAEARQLGIDGYVKKPFIMEDMKKLITKTVAERSSSARRSRA